MSKKAARRDPGSNGGIFRRFWESTGERFPDLSGAPSTRYYLECERYLLERFFPGLQGKTLLKTDLWDEAKNTRILFHAAVDLGAEPYGEDISLAIVRRARDHFAANGRRGRFAVSDMRAMAFRDNAFDFLYSMGTAEHFLEYRQALEECYRVLKPGGTALIGVPNRLDPFLRPLLVAALHKLGLYAYGYERSFTPARLERLLRSIGFRVTARTGILFMPGVLRIAELFLYVHWPGSAAVFKPLIAPFARLYRRSDLIKRAGYLTVSVVRKPGRAAD